MKTEVAVENKWETLASTENLKKVGEKLAANGMDFEIAENGQVAKEMVLNSIEKGSEVFTMTSVTLETIGVASAINESKDFVSVRNQLNQMDRATKGREMRKLGASPDVAVGSVHAITEEGQVVVVSNTGSQLPAYASGAGKVIWVVGAQKIVKNLDEALKRINEYVLPLEAERIKKAYPGATCSNVSKILIVNKEVKPGRIKVILVKEKLGF